MRHLILITISTLLLTVSVQGQWKIYEDFNDLYWEAQEWPLTEGATITWDEGRSISGKSSLSTTIDCKGWGGGLKVTNAPLTQPPTKGMSVSILCEPQPGATGVPAAKLEVYPAGGGDTMGGPDTPLVPCKWTTVPLPASNVTKPFSGCGIIFLKAGGNGKYKIWVDALIKDGEVWENFEYSQNSHPWKPVNINGAYEYHLVESGYSGMPALQGGTAVRLAWKDDLDGVELKQFHTKPLDITSWKKIRVRVALKSGTPKLRPSLWLFDGSKGSLAMGPHIEPAGSWQDIDHDLASHRGIIDFKHITEIGVVLHEYNGKSGEIFLDRIQYE